MLLIIGVAGQTVNPQKELIFHLSSNKKEARAMTVTSLYETEGCCTPKWTVRELNPRLTSSRVGLYSSSTAYTAQSTPQWI